jgi:predicted nucleic acid-binding protein
MKIFDSWAWVEYFRGSKAGERVREMIDSDEVLSTPAVCLTEVKAKYLAEGHDPSGRLELIKGRTSIVDVTAAIAEDAADLKSRHRLHTVDALVYACAQAAGGELVTGDKHFRGLPDVKFLGEPS